MKKVAIDLTWVRHNKVGGTESCIRNLLDGIAEIETKGILFILLVSKDNAYSFQKYNAYACFQVLICNTYSEILIKRVIWQNIKMGQLLRKMDISTCLEPVYGKPYLGCRNIRFVTIIHDLQAMHYPQYFSKLRVAWMKSGWRNAVKSSTIIVAISQYVKDDIINTYGISDDKVKVIYDAIKLDADVCSNENDLVHYGVEKGRYYYTVSSLFLHKNLKTAILAIKELKESNSNVFYPLVVSGIGGRKRNDLDKLIADADMQNDIIFTPFVSVSERNMLYKNCKAFLFPSIFEGFGMPPLEAMAMGVPVLTTKCTSIMEVTENLLNYVEDPMNPKEWAEKLEDKLKLPEKAIVDNLLRKYSSKIVAEKMIKVILETMV